MIALDFGNNFCNHGPLAEVDEIRSLEEVRFAVLGELDHALKHAQKRNAGRVDFSQFLVQLLVPEYKKKAICQLGCSIKMCHLRNLLMTSGKYSG